MWLLDVNVSRNVQRFLEEHGHDPLSLIELGARRLKNGDFLAKARKLKRIILSYDQDLIRLTRGKHPGVIIVRIHPCTDEEIIPVLNKFLDSINPEKIENNIIIIEKNKVIIRQME